MRTRVVVFCLSVLSVLAPAIARAQVDDPQHADHATEQASSSPWMLMSDGVLFATFNHQGGPRGGDEFTSTNWWMGMASRNAGAGRLTLTGMISLDPLTATSRGYRELFQVGEEYQGRPLVDWQHPHDFLMQAAVVWRVPIGAESHLTIAGAPVGEPALGPIAFMHRASAADNPAAPLAHHTLDSTHIAMGVLTTAVEHGPFTIEGSIFHGAEPDDNRWDLMDPGALDSWSARVWFRPSSEWQLQASHGFLKKPEALEAGDVRRTTASVDWLHASADDFTAATIAVGRNDKEHGAFSAFLAELTSHRGATSLYGRLESVDTETALLQNPLTADAGLNEPPSLVTALTIGAVRDLTRWRGFDVGAGADLTVYAVPDALRASHGDHPTSVHVFLRVRPPAGHMGRLWNMRMAKPGM
jgi:hypothetical protein